MTTYDALVIGAGYIALTVNEARPQAPREGGRGGFGGGRGGSRY
jgi:hypothetical protein